MSTLLTVFAAIFLGNSLYATPTLKIPSPNDKTCTFYPNLEKQLNCKNESPYLLDYGLPFCKKFQERKQRWQSMNLKSWIPKTTLCLQTALTNPSDLNPCIMMERTAFNSHPTCYFNSGFCELNYYDQQSILNVVSWADIQGRLTESAFQGYALSKLCSISNFEIFLHVFEYFFSITREMDKSPRLAAAKIFLEAPQDPQQATNYIQQKFYYVVTGDLNPSPQAMAELSATFKGGRLTNLENIYNDCKVKLDSNSFCRELSRKNQGAIKSGNFELFKNSLTKKVLEKRLENASRLLDMK